MTSIGDTARIRPPKDVFEDTKVKAFEVWTRGLKAATARGADPMSSAIGAKGLRFRGSMSEVIRQCYPASRSYGLEDWNNFSRSILAHLKATGNAVCLSSPPSPIIWFISQEWNDSSQPGREPTAREKAERKVTPHEAGEDRTPGEVQYRMVASGGNVATSAPAETDKPAHEDAYAVLVKKIHATIRQWPEPSVMPEIASALGLDIGQVNRTLNKMLKDRIVYDRAETRDERTARASGVVTSSRRARLMWHLNPVPPRTLPEFVAGTAPTNGRAALEAASKLREGRLSVQREKMDELMLDMLLAEGGRFTLWNTIVLKLDRDTAPFVGEEAVRSSFRRLEKQGMVTISDSVGTHRAVVVSSIDYVAPLVPVALTKPVVVKRRTGTGTFPETENPVDRAVLKLLEAAKVPMCAQDVADVTGYSRGRVSDTFRMFPGHVRRVGSKDHHHLYAWNVRKESAPATPPIQETPMTTTAPPVASTPTPTPRDVMLEALATLATGLNAPIVPLARVAELEAEVAALKERLTVAQRKITALSEV